MASKHTKITILVDNHALDQSVASIREGGGLVSEHGLSFWVESGGKIVLFDTGRGPALQKNAPALGIDLEATDYLVLSHGHYDHTGGVPQALSEASEVEVYCHPGVLRTRYVIKDKKVKSIGIPRRPRKALRKLPSGRLHWVLGPSMLTDSIGITGPVPRLTDYEDTGGPFYQDSAGWRPDPIEDDQALWISTGKGLVVCFGCAHSGAVNTLEYVRYLNPGMNVHAVLGGFHLMNADEHRLEKTIETFCELDIPMVVPCHCTGADAYRTLAGALGETVSPGAAGATFEF